MEDVGGGECKLDIRVRLFLGLGLYQVAHIRSKLKIYSWLCSRIILGGFGGNPMQFQCQELN